MAWTVALAGNGETTQENAVALLDDWLPVEDVTLVFPKLTRRDTLMRGLVKWAEEENIEVANDQVDLIGNLNIAKAADTEVYLVLAWDDSEGSSKLLEAALANGIPVKDLTRALDDLEFDDEDESGGDPLPSDDHPAVVGSYESVPAEADDTVAESTVQAEVVGPATLAPGFQQPPLSETIGSLVDEWIRGIVRQELMAAGVIKPPPPVHALVDADGNYRQAKKGRPRKGETAVLLTHAEVIEKGLTHLLETEDE